MTTDADREEAQEWAAGFVWDDDAARRFGEEHYADGLAAGRAEERERCAKVLADMGDSLEDAIRNDETGRKASERYRELLDLLSETAAAIRKGA